MFEDDPASPPACRIAVKVVPGARADALAGPLGERLKIRVAAPPEDGKANKAVCRLLASALGVRPSDAEVVSGHARPEKMILVRGVSAADARAALLPDSPA